MIVPPENDNLVLDHCYPIPGYRQSSMEVDLSYAKPSIFTHWAGLVFEYTTADTVISKVDREMPRLLAVFDEPPARPLSTNAGAMARSMGNIGKVCRMGRPEVAKQYDAQNGKWSYMTAGLTYVSSCLEA